MIAGGRPDRRRVADRREHAAHRRAEDEAEPEGRADQAVGPRAILRLGDVGHVGPRRRDVAARQPVDDARDEQHREAARPCASMTKLTHRAGEAEDQHRPPAVAIRQVAEDRRRDQLAEREHREQQADRRAATRRTSPRRTAAAER